jgi:hypothetical protein
MVVIEWPWRRLTRHPRPESGRFDVTLPQKAREMLVPSVPERRIPTPL